VTIDDFESVALTQVPAAKAWQPVTDFSIFGRRLAEGKHPKLILDVLKPTSILDVGCGPDACLVTLLKELRPACLDRIRGIDKITHGRVADLADPLMALAWDRSADVVICREVLEHLTLREIRVAVTNLCTMTQRLCYGTTRFSSDDDLYRVETSDDLDPTHITLPSKALLRVLFALEGFKYRADLARAMDWMQKGRTFVYERA
jgi:Methyltransferase domain